MIWLLKQPLHPDCLCGTLPPTTVSCPVVTRASFTKSKTSGVTLITLIHLVLRFRMLGTLFSQLPLSVWLCYVDFRHSGNFIFYDFTLPTLECMFLIPADFCETFHLFTRESHLHTNHTCIAENNKEVKVIKNSLFVSCLPFY